MSAGGLILVLNAGSSSIKAALFDADLTDLNRVEASGIGAPGGPPDHAAALSAVLDQLDVPVTRLRAVGHRVVQGGRALTQAQPVTAQVRAAITACIPLAPLHNPHHLAAMDALAALAPDLPQVASFDTAFHATNPDLARAYALPDQPETADILRYGFHGNSYASLVHALPRQTGAPLPPRLLAFHLGNGSSICAIKDGQSVATTMGFSPLSGVTMGTRCGDIDAAAVLYLAKQIGIEQTETLLNRQSGLQGLSGISSDMRTLMASDDPVARFAVDHFCYWAARHAGSLIAAMGGVDGFAFTGGIGENAVAIRAKILEHLSWLGDLPHWVVPADEERHIARETLACLEESPAL